MTPDPTPQSPDHGAAGFCTHHAIVADATVEIGGEIMTLAQFDAARFPLLHPGLGSVVHGDEHVMTFDAHAPDERTETVARVLDPRAWDDSWFWDCDPPLHDDRIEAAQRAQIKRQDVARAQAAAVVAALDDETARLRAASLSVIAAVLRAGESDRAALDRVRALPTWDTSSGGTKVVWASDIAAALDPEEPR